MRGIGARGRIAVLNGRLLHDVLDVTAGERLSGLLGCLEPKGNDTGCHGSSHRSTLHHSIRIGRTVDHEVAAEVASIVAVVIDTGCMVVVHTGCKAGTRSRNPRILNACGALVGGSVAGEIGDITDSINVTHAIGRATGGFPCIGGYVCADGDDIGISGLVTYTHVIRTIGPCIAAGREVIGEVAVAASPSVDGAASAGGIELHSQGIFALIIGAAVLRCGGVASGGETRGVEHNLALVGADVILISIKCSAEIARQSAHRSTAGAWGDGDRSLDSACAGVKNENLASKATATQLGARPCVGDDAIVVVSGIGVAVGSSTQDRAERATARCSTTYVISTTFSVLRLATIVGSSKETNMVGMA